MSQEVSLKLLRGPMNSFSSSALDGVSLSSSVLFLVCLGLLASTSIPAYSRLASATGASTDEEDEEEDEDSSDDDMITTDEKEKRGKESGEKKREKQNGGSQRIKPEMM